MSRLRKQSRSYCRRTPCARMGFSQKASCRPYKNCYRDKRSKKTSRTRRRSKKTSRTRRRSKKGSRTRRSSKNIKKSKIRRGSMRRSRAKKRIQSMRSNSHAPKRRLRKEFEEDSVGAANEAPQKISIRAADSSALGYIIWWCATSSDPGSRNLEFLASPIGDQALARLEDISGCSG